MIELNSDLSNIIKTQIYYKYTITTDILTEESKHTLSEKFWGINWLL